MLALIYWILEIETKFKIVGYVFSSKARGILYDDYSRQVKFEARVHHNIHQNHVDLLGKTI